MTTFEIVIVTVGFTVALLALVTPWPWRWNRTKDVYDAGPSINWIGIFAH